jgi:hypothetical protein
MHTCEALATFLAHPSCRLKVLKCEHADIDDAELEAICKVE